MQPVWLNLKEHEREAVFYAVTFLTDRMEELAAIEWALELKSQDTIRRNAILCLIDSQIDKISEPWRTAWRLIEEYWSTSEIDDYFLSLQIQNKIGSGDKSGATIKLIVDSVAPRLKLESINKMASLSGIKILKKPKRVDQIMYMMWSSGNLMDLEAINLNIEVDVQFLISLNHALNSTILNSLNLSIFIGWNLDKMIWKLNLPQQVNYASNTNQSLQINDPDYFHQGFTPSIRLLHAVTSRLVDINLPVAKEIINQWKLINSPIYLRLWASFCENPKIISAVEVGDYFLKLDDIHFWDINNDYPEIARLRRSRFKDFTVPQQSALFARIRKLPPIKLWSVRKKSKPFSKSQVFQSINEFIAIEKAGVTLLNVDKLWVNENIKDFPMLIDLNNTNTIDTSKKAWLKSNPDPIYDSIISDQRLSELEAALSTGSGWSEQDQAYRAESWINQQSNYEKIIQDMEKSENAGSNYTRVWNKFCQSHLPTIENEDKSLQRNLSNECIRVVDLLGKLLDNIILQNISAISWWLLNWREYIFKSSRVHGLWIKLWKIAIVDIQNSNNPIGNLLDVFFSDCHIVHNGNQPFSKGSHLREMRDAVEASLENNDLIIKTKLIQQLPYFLRADPEWSQEKLIHPLHDKNKIAWSLWKAVGRIQAPTFELIQAIGGDTIAEQAINTINLDRETRQSLVFWIIYECLDALLNNRTSIVTKICIQQMLRKLDNEVRLHAVNSIEHFVLEKTRTDDLKTEKIFHEAVNPFILTIWPKEKSLITPNISKTFARLPALSGKEFVNTVDAVERFLMPFNAFTLTVYNLVRQQNQNSKLWDIDETEADALLRLLDLTIGESDNFSVPRDLEQALDKIQEIAPKLTSDLRYRRLRTTIRRL